MIFKGKFKVIENIITACDYEFVLKKIEEAVKNKKSLLISPIASHTLVRAKYNKNLKKILDGFEYLVPDSQWVRWGLDWLYKIKLPDRIYGPNLFLKLCQNAEKRNIKVALIGNNLEKLKQKLKNLFPNLKISLLIELDNKVVDEKLTKKINKKIKKLKKAIIFIGIGSPKQHQLALKLDVNSPIVCIGAAFDFISGVKKQAPKWMGDWGLEWLFRLINEPKLWERYFLSIFIIFWNIIIKTRYLLGYRSK